MGGLSLNLGLGLVGGPSPPTENLVLKSQDITVAPWVNDGTTDTANTVNDPFGALTADTLTVSAGGAEIYQSITIPTTEHTFSWYAKKNNNDWIRFNYNNNRFAWFNLATGVVGSATSSTPYIVDAGSGWYRCVMVFTPGAANGYVALDLVTADNVSTRAANGQAVYLWQAQATTGNWPDGSAILLTA